MAVDFRAGTPGTSRDAVENPPTEALASRRWAFVEDIDVVRIALWGTVGPRETAALDTRLLTLRARSAPLIFDLTGVSELHEESVTWLGLRHEEFGRERPMMICVVADGRVHRRLTRPDAPRLRLTLE